MKKSVGSIVRGNKFRYGGTAVAFTVAFIALIIVVNVIFTALAEKYRWYIDMTGDEIFSLSDAAKDALAPLRETDQKVTITFCMDKDAVEGDRSMYYIHNTAQNIAAEFDNVEIEYRDALRENKYLEKFTSAMSPYVATTNVIISSGTEYRKLAYTKFFIIDSEGTGEVWAYEGENTFTSAILQVTADEMPIAYFTTQHGENTSEESDAGAFKQIMEEAGFEVRDIDLSKEEIDEAGRVLIINDPKTDFGGKDDEHVGKSEIDKIDAFLDGLGNLMVFVSPENAGKLSNLEEFLEEWGVGFTPDVTVNDQENSVSTNGYSVVGQYLTGEENLSSSIYKEITSMSSQPKAIFRNSMPLRHTWDTDSYTTPDQCRRTICDVFRSSDSARLNEDGELGESGTEYSLMTITQEYGVKNNLDYSNYVIVAGTSDFVASEYIFSNVFTNRSVIHSCLITLGKKNVPTGIQYKVFEDYDLDITTAQAETWSRILIIAMPAATVIACIVVTVRRKYK